MATINKLNHLISHLNLAAKPTVAAVWPQDTSTLNALRRALNKDMVNVITVGCAERVTKHLDRFIGSSSLIVVDADTPEAASDLAVSLARQGEADILMKGLVKTDVLLHAVLNKEHGLMTPGNVLTHITVGDIPQYDKLLMFTDVAVLPCPTLAQREAQVRYITRLARSIGVATPAIAMVHCSEKVDERHFPVTADYRELAARAARGDYGDCMVDGPMDVKTSCDAHAARVKGIKSPVAGIADALLFPEIESGNAFYKAMTLFGEMRTAAIVCGANVPLVVPSRGDDFRNKFYSLALACALTVNP